MKAQTKLVFLNGQDERFFGEGPCRLLRMVEETGSLNAASAAMDMAYTKALRLLKNAEAALGFPLTTRVIGGRNGGGSRLTDAGRAWLDRYEAYRDACVRANRELYQEYFPSAGCVIMASGMGKRFGGNKLMADFDGEPMIVRALRATDGLFDCRVVVTRHADVAAICREQGAEVVFHALPLRSDTVRLGLEAVGDVDGCMFCPGDQPLLRRETVAALLCQWRGEKESIWRTAFRDMPGLPMMFPSWTFDDLLNLPEGKGGGYVLGNHPDRVRCMQVSDECELMDADTPDALDVLQAYTPK